MKIKLNIKDRLIMPDLLPSQSSMVEQITVRAILKKIELTSDEVDKWGIRDISGGRIEWDATKVKEIEYEFNKAEIQLLKNGVDRLNDEKKVTQQNLDLCEKIRSAKNE